MDKSRRIDRTESRFRVIAAIAVCCLAAAGEKKPMHPPLPAPSVTPTQGEAVIPPSPPQSAPRIIAPRLDEAPAPGKGRLDLIFSGNRRWCTFPDDRPIKPPEDPRKPVIPGHENEVTTFGYQFTAAAIERGAPDRPIMLFESPVFRTAQLMPAVKLGGLPGPHKVQIGPSMGSQPRSDRGRLFNSGATEVPRWDESDRCTTLPERFEFDLAPGTYDLYLAFDILGREGGWLHRTSDYLTDVAVEAGRTTLVNAVADMPGGPERRLSLDKASLLPAGESAGADGP